MRCFFFLTAAAVWIPQGVTPQRTSVQCAPTYDWAQNSMGQSPCLVASHLQNQCIGSHASPCMCSTVLYSLFAACADCQGAGYQRWPEWSANCSNIFVSMYIPGVIQAQTVIPQWAFADVVSKGLYDPSAARQISVDGLDTASASPVPTETVSITETEAILSASQPNASINARAQGGIIAGAVVAGFIVFSVFVILSVFLMRQRRRSRIAPSAAYKAAYGLSPPPMVQLAQTQRFSVLDSPTKKL
ncbi:hypothetical protein BD779DRAFT_1509285 [Infundibulicybe gibba]|nr:hypothetical protein BD779DRAFT_1509285 [Infundibulicybe gibba]